MNTYFATFVSGTSELVRRQMKTLKDVIVLKVYDGLVIFKSSGSWKELQNIRYFNNVFLLLASKENKKSGESLLGVLISSVAREGIRLPRRFHEIIRGKRSFKVFTAIENRTVSVDKSLLQKVEHQIKKVSGLRLYIPQPDLEFWFIARREGFGLFGLRLTRVRRENRGRGRGELKIEVAHTLFLISEPKSYDIVCDPFAGHGAIVIERARSFPYREIYASDVDETSLRELQKRARGLKNIHISRADALHLNLPDASVDKIITDPPWGEYQEMPNLEVFYEKMLGEFSRILKTDGDIVILTSAKEILERALREKFNRVLKIEERYDVLVSGKKAAMYKLRKASVRHG